MNKLASGELVLRSLRLGDVAEITMGQSPESASLNTNEEGLPFLQGCAEFGRKSPLTTIYCNPALRVSKPESILISIRAPVGTLNLGDQSYCIGRGLAAIRAVKNAAETGFLFYVIAHNANFLHRRSQGSTFLAIGSNDLRIFPVPDLNIAKQQKIARILQTIDRAIEQTEALIEKYQQIKAGLMHDLFTCGIGPDGQLRPPREQAPHLYQQTSIGWIPKEWSVEPIISVADVIDPNPSHRNPIYHDDGYPFISTVEFEAFDQIKLDTPRRVVEDIVLDQERRCKFSELSIAFSRKGTIGEIRILPSHLRFALLDSLCVINATNIRPKLLFYMLKSSSLKRQIKNMTIGQALPQVSIGRVRELLLPVPLSKVEQEGVEAKLGTIDLFLLEQSQQLTKLESIKSGLMHDLLTGKVPVTPDPEPTHD